MVTHGLPWSGSRTEGLSLSGPGATTLVGAAGTAVKPSSGALWSPRSMVDLAQLSATGCWPSDRLQVSMSNFSHLSRPRLLDLARHASRIEPECTSARASLLWAEVERRILSGEEFPAGLSERATKARARAVKNWIKAGRFVDPDQVRFRVQQALEKFSKPLGPKRTQSVEQLIEEMIRG